MITARLASVAAAAGCTVRPVRDADRDGLRALIGGVFAEYPGCVLDPDGLDADLAAWRTHLDELGGAGWVVHEAGGRIVACVGGAPTSDLPDGAAAAVDVGAAAGAVELKRLYVHADVRRVGFGRALVEQVEDWARGRGAHLVVLWSDTRFEDAHRLYGRLGYQPLAARRALHDPSDTIEAAFARRLDHGSSSGRADDRRR